MSVTSSILYALLVVAIWLANKLRKVGSRAPGLPPGPPTISVLGNLHLMPKEKAHLQLQKWAKKYGPVYSLILGTKTMVVLSSDTAVKDLLDKKSSIYSDRPDMFISQIIASGNQRVVLMRYGDEWRAIHRMIHNFLNVKAVATYMPYQDLENKILLGELVDKPDTLLPAIRRYTFSLSTQMIYGFRCIDNKDPKLLELFENFENWGQLAGSASAQLTDLYPIMQKLPEFIAPNVKYARGLHQNEKRLFGGLWSTAKEGLNAGTGLPCFCNEILKAQKIEAFSDLLASYISGSLLEAGSDTTASVLYAFVLAVIVWPDVQKKAQEEVDRVVGPDRLPVFEDYDNLPYIRCCIKESLRWMPTAVLAVPHAANKDDTYMGYTIPKGTTIIDNIWSIHMDPERSPNPRVFDPERFRGDNTSLHQSAIGDEKLRDTFVFGAGRRLCQGIHIAERSLFLGIARFMWAFNFTKAQTEEGKPFAYDVDDLVGNLTIQPTDFPAAIRSRSAERLRIVRKAIDDDNRELLDAKTGQWKKLPKGMAFGARISEKSNA